jgi:pilus assembly protein CpaF
MREGVRRVTEVVEVVGLEEDIISLGSLFAYRFVGENPDGSLKGVFEATGTRPRFLPRLEYFGLGAAFLAAISPHPPGPA